MTVPHIRSSPSRALSQMGTTGQLPNSSAIPTRDIIAKVKADLIKKKEREKQVEKVLKEQIEVKRYNCQKLNERCDEAIDKVKTQ